jgi:polysaccharide pyruvyl transferase WcaK-like protein
MICGDLWNLGDLALLLQNLEIARSLGRRAFVRRWGALPCEIEAQVEEAGGTFVDGRKPAKLLAVARGSDIVIGGGQLVRANVSPKSLALLLAAVLAAKSSGGRVTTRGLGVSPIGRGLPLFLWRSVLTLADDVRVRDEASLRNARQIAPRAKALLTADMAFYPSRLHKHAGSSLGSAPTILIAPCIDPSEGRSLDGAVFPALVELAQARFPQAELVFACHDARPGMDGEAADTLIRRHTLRARKSAPHDLKAFLQDYKSAELVITNRLHSVVFALLSGRPVLAVNDGSPKIDAVAQAFSVSTVRLEAAAEAEGAIERALGFDRAARHAALETAAAGARRNIEDGTSA